jgi:RND family efflux transporter MFP subunit
MDHYRRQARLIGAVNAASDSAVGFEVAGTIDHMPARVGTPVNKGDILASLNAERRRAVLAAAEAELARVDAELELAKLRRQRLADLEAKGLAAKQSFDEARLSEQALAASQKAIRARRLSAQLDIDKSTLRAPFDGVVASRLVQEGAVVNAGTPVLRLVAASGYEAHIGVPTQLRDQLIVGDLYSLELGGQRFSAPLRAIRADLDTTTLTVGAVFALPDTVEAVAGESVALALDEQINEPGGWLPLTALLEGDRGLWNILVTAKQNGTYTAQREAVEVIYVASDRVFVRGTLADGAQVVATGLQRLSPGSAIAPVPILETTGASPQ